MDTFVARQPILNGKGSVFAYELLFRSGPDNFFPQVDADVASSQVIADSVSVFGFSSLLAGKKAFVNVTSRVLAEQWFTILPNEHVVLELLETVEPDDDVIRGVRALKDAGYVLALDDFEDRPDYEPLIELADIIKVDFLATDSAGRRQLSQRYGGHASLLAEKVETQDDVDEGLDLGYDYFQGYFFCKPEMISRREVPAFKLNYLRFIKELFRPEADFDKLEQIIKQEVSLSVKLLRLMNSAAFGYGGNVNSVRQALLILGERQVKRWATMIALGEMGVSKPEELVVTCLARARLCELLARPAGLPESTDDLFLVGMLSLVDALVGRPIGELIDEMAVSDGIKAGVLEPDSQLGRVRTLAVAMERAKWDEIPSKSVELDIQEDSLPAKYGEAVEWGSNVFRS